MDDQERADFLQQFDHPDSSPALLGFAVLGGIYSEGVDLKGEKLLGTAIIGTGLPKVGTEQEILRDYYQQKNNQGYDFAYRYPGMNKVLQAAGRVIRGQNDRGVVLLLDDRFSTLLISDSSPNIGIMPVSSMTAMGYLKSFMISGQNLL